MRSYFSSSPYTNTQVQPELNNHSVSTFKKEITPPKRKVSIFRVHSESQISEANNAATQEVSIASTQMLLLARK
jgi:hypothetical protein